MKKSSSTASVVPGRIWAFAVLLTMFCATDLAAQGTLQIVTSSLPDATFGVMYSAPLTASGGTPGYTWSIVSGTLPPGLTLNVTVNGTAIGGIPTGTGQSTF